MAISVVSRGRFKLRDVSVRPVYGAAELRRWDALMREFHYLPFKGLFGQSLRQRPEYPDHDPCIKHPSQVRRGSSNLNRPMKERWDSDAAYRCSSSPVMSSSRVYSDKQDENLPTIRMRKPPALGLGGRA